MRTKTVFLLLLACLAVLAASGVHAAESKHADWMTQNKETLKNLAINHVTLLGSHDAASCHVHTGSHPCTGYLTHTGHHITRKASGKDVNSARCQSVSIEHLLLYGVRYFDMRIAHQNGEYWGVHMWLSTPLLGEGGVFPQIKDFLQNHPDEILILNLNELYSDHGPMNQHQTESFYEKLNKEFGPLLVPRGDFATTTLGSLWNGTGRIIAIRNPGADITAEKIIWDREKVDSQWGCMGRMPISSAPD